MLEMSANLAASSGSVILPAESSLTSVESSPTIRCKMGFSSLSLGMELISSSNFAHLEGGKNTEIIPNVPFREEHQNEIDVNLWTPTKWNRNTPFAIHTVLVNGREYYFVVSVSAISHYGFVRHFFH